MRTVSCLSDSLTHALIDSRLMLLNERTDELDVELLRTHSHREMQVEHERALNKGQGHRQRQGKQSLV